MHATCHCSSISLTLPPPTPPLNGCACSVCARYGAVWAYYPTADVVFTKGTRGAVPPVSNTPAPTAISDPTPTSNPSPPTDEEPGLATIAYAHGKRNIAFHFCPRCYGLMFWWNVDESRAKMMAVNTRMVRERAELEGCEFVGEK